MDDRTNLPEEEQRDLLDPRMFPATVQVSGREYTSETPVDGGKKAVVWKVRDQVGRARALKLTCSADYEGKSYLQEMSRAATLERYPEFARLEDSGICEITLSGGKSGHYVSFIEEWVEGATLEAFLERSQDLSISFFLTYVAFVSRMLTALNTVGFRHDDLHARNVMIVDPPEGSPVTDWVFKVIDMGSLKPAAASSHKPKDDHRHCVEHLVAIWNAIHRRRSALSLRDRRFLKEAACLLRSMLDADLGIAALRDPAAIRKQHEDAYTRSATQSRRHTPQLNSPFEFISAEHMADDRLLINIFATSCPWLEKVNGPDPCIITGPRGCGKSTIFRWLSLKAHLHKPLSDLALLQISGFYISCSTDLQNRLGGITTEPLAQRFRKEIIHYFNLLVAREIVNTLCMLRTREDRETYWNFGTTAERRVSEFIIKSLGPMPRESIQGTSPVLRIREIIEEKMFHTHERLLRGVNLAYTTPATFLGDFTSFLTELVPHFAERKIAVLVDDFSIHRIPEPVQVVLNSIIWERRPSHVFKLSAEKYGAVLVDPNDGTADLSREMIEVDCGREFIALDDSRSTDKARAFAVDLLNHRLKSAQYIGTAETLLGRSPRTSLAKSLLDRRRGRHLAQYWGLERIADLCSGDAAHLLLVYRRIFEKAGLDKSSTSQVNEMVQHDCIRDVSRELWESIKAYPPHGEQMYEIVSAFGNLVRRILEEGKWQTNGSPTQCPRIEIDQVKGGVIEGLSSTQRKIAVELIRRSIFIDMGPGLSRHVNMTTMRWHLRRIFLPAFGAALAKNDAVKEAPEWFKFLVTNPGEACEMIWKKWPRRAPADGEPGLFTHREADDVL